MLLRRFAMGDRLDAFDLNHARIVTTSVQNSAVERRFYDFQVDRNVVSPEAWLGRIESRAAAVLAKLSDDPGCIETLSGEEEGALSRFVVAQDLRGPHTLELVNLVRSHMVDHAKAVTRAELVRDLGPESAEVVWAAAFEDEADERWLNEDEPYQKGEGLASMLGEVDGLASVLRSMPWRGGEVPTGFRLYTCDNPVARNSPSFRWPVFFQHQYLLALSPRVLLVFGPGASESGVGSRRRRDFTPWQAVFANRTTTTSASRYLYGTVRTSTAKARR